MASDQTYFRRPMYKNDLSVLDSSQNSTTDEIGFTSETTTQNKETWSDRQANKTVTRNNFITIKFENQGES